MNNLMLPGSYVEKVLLACRTSLFYEHVKYVLSVSFSLRQDQWSYLFRTR